MSNPFYLFICLSFCTSFLVGSAQNELYIQGDSTSTIVDLYLNGKEGSEPTLFINGSLSNQGGKLINDSSFLEIQSNFHNSTYYPNSYYQSSGTEKFSGEGNTILSGNFSGDSANLNQVHYLIIAKDSIRARVDLANSLHLHKNGSINFENFGILRTDTLSHANNGELYASYLFIQNTSNSTIINHAMISGDSSKYIEGKLRWQLADGDSSYFFPIGGEYSMEAMAIDIKDAEMLSIEAYINDENSIGTLAENGRVYFDIGTPSSANSTIASAGCSAGADGILDLIELNLNADVTWQINKISNGTWQSYDLVLSPSTQRQVSIYNPMLTSGNCENIDLIYLSKNGIPGGNNSQYLSGVSPAWPNISAYEAAPAQAYNLLALNGYALLNQNNFGIYGIHSTEASNVSLPVELLRLEARSVQNEYIQLNWETLTELNNSGFEILRSEDGLNFEFIGWQLGAGSSSSLQSYSFNDYEVNQGQIYYYRLRQIDFDGSASLSKIVSAKLLQKNENVQLSIYPNPFQQYTYIQLTSANDDLAKIVLFDNLGKQIWQQMLPIQSGETKILIPTAHLSEGSYRLQIDLSLESFSEQLIKFDK